MTVQPGVSGSPTGRILDWHLDDAAVCLHSSVVLCVCRPSNHSSAATDLSLLWAATLFTSRAQVCSPQLGLRGAAGHHCCLDDRPSRCTPALQARRAELLAQAPAPAPQKAAGLQWCRLAPGSPRPQRSAAQHYSAQPHDALQQVKHVRQPCAQASRHTCDLSVSTSTGLASDRLHATKAVP